jgi:hypothetical protein
MVEGLLTIFCRTVMIEVPIQASTSQLILIEILGQN